MQKQSQKTQSQTKQWSICDKHKKKQKTIQRVLPNANICMNRYCPNSFTFMCSACKHQHKDHSIKVLTLQDIKNFLQNLVKSPHNNNLKYIKQSINVMKKIKFIKDTRKKIDYLQSQILKQASNLIDVTQGLISQYATCRQSAQYLTQRLRNVNDIQVFEKFKASSKEYLSQLDYNFKKDCIELGNLVIKQKQDKRKKLIQSTKRKIEQVRDYIPDDDSQSQQDQFQDLINQKKNFYKKLKQQLFVDKALQKKQKQFLKEKDQQDFQRDDQRSKSTTVSNNVKKFYQSNDCQSQTCDQWIIDMRQQIVNLKHELDQLSENKNKQENLLKQQIEKLNKQKLKLEKQVDSYNQKLFQQKKYIKQFSKRLKIYLLKRKEADKQKQLIYQKMLQIQWK